MEIRVENPADAEAIRAVNEDAFGQPNEADIVDAVRTSPAAIPELSLVAVHEGLLVGHILFSKATVESDGEAVTILALGPVAVPRTHQKQGVGSALIFEGLERARALGYRGVVLIGHPSYYPRFGFVPASRFGLKTTFDVSDDVFQALPLIPGGLDDTRGTVHYAPAFE